MSTWKFKPEQRENGLAKLDEFLLDRSAKGYRGYLKLQSDNEPNNLTLITLWETQEALDTSRKDLYKQRQEGTLSFTSTPQELEPYVANPPTVHHLKLNAELRI
jgi:heme-degrading monooxygenase HmoA